MKKYTSNEFINTKYGIFKSAQDIITSLPTTIIADGQSASAIIKGNMQQSGTPTTTTPIYPSDCGDLVESGEHANQYEIPILCGNTTTNVYLGEVQSTRRIRKVVFDGTENWIYRQGEPSNIFFIEILGLEIVNNLGLCSHYSNQDNGSFSVLEDKHLLLRLSADSTKTYIAIRDSDFLSITDIKGYIAQQYANGTPICVWYVLITPTTDIVNEPIRKIGNYTDSVSVSNLPTTGTAEQFDIDTTLKPSEVQLTYTGWHLYNDKKYTNGDWI